MKNQKIIIISFVVLAVGILAYYIYYKSKKSTPQPKPEAINNDTNKTTVSNGNKINQNLIFPIKKGDAGEHVKELQRGLNNQYFFVRKLKKLQPLNNDGKFGKNTEDMLFDLYGVKQVTKDLAKRMYKDNGIVMPDWFDNIK